MSGAFWNAPRGWGRDSRPGTIIHEFTHHVFGTSDYAYGEHAIKSLDEQGKIRNADNYEALVERIMMAHNRDEL